MKEVKISGFTTDCASNFKPAVCCFGDDNSGTTRFGTTAPCDDGFIGWIAIDRNSKEVVEQQKRERNLPIIVNTQPIISHADSIKVAMEDDTAKVKEVYKRVFEQLMGKLMDLAKHPDVESVVIDRASQVFDIILFSHFGRRNQIESFQRGAPNQDMIDLINALGSKNLVLLCKASEIWKDTGEVDSKSGRKKQAPTGKFKPDGFNQIGRFVTAVIELTAERRKLTGTDEDDILNKKYKCKVVTCKGNTLLEGSELTNEGICGRSINWKNLMTVIGPE